MVCFFQTRYLKYSNGEETIKRTIVGDTATAKNAITNQAIDAANAFAFHARQVFEQRVTVSKIRDLNVAMQGATGVSVFDAMRALYYTNFVDTLSQDKNWRVQASGQNNFNVTFRYMQNGNLRISGLLDKQGVAVGNRNADLLGNSWLSIPNYPVTGTATNLFLSQDGKKWIALDRSYIFQKQ